MKLETSITKIRDVNVDQFHTKKSADWTNLTKVFQKLVRFMDKSTLRNARCVCKKWRDAIIKMHTCLGPIWFPLDSQIRMRFSTCTYLQTVDLRSCARLTDASIKYLCKLQQLRSLTLKGAFQLSENVFTFLPTSLQYLSLQSALNVTHARIGHLKALCFLDLTGCNSLKALNVGEKSRLLSLNLCGCVNLEELSIGNCLNSSPFLRHLNLAGCMIYDALLSILLQHSNLESLSLSSCPSLSNAGFITVSELSTIQKLDLTDTSISDFGVAKLAYLPNLQRIGLSQCPRLTKAGCWWMLQNSQSEAIQKSLQLERA